MACFGLDVIQQFSLKTWARARENNRRGAGHAMKRARREQSNIYWSFPTVSSARNRIVRALYGYERKFTHTLMLLPLI